MPALPSAQLRVASLFDVDAAPLPGLAVVVVRLLGWLLFAVLLTWPVILKLDEVLIGNPDVDVWNHAWGYGWVARALGEGTFPYYTSLLGAPAGGKLYVADLLGALLAAPLTALVGPGPTFNLVLIGRIATAGLAAQLLAEELLWGGASTEPASRRAGGVLAGLAYASSPFLLCELSNGISEVCSLDWVALTLLATVRALRGGGAGRWALVGALGALTTIATFYYGLLTAIMAGLLVLGRFGTLLRRGEARPMLWRVGLAVAVSLLLAGPFMIAFRASFEGPDALVERPMEISSVLLLHNAVDPWIYVRPGRFVSVDMRSFGESFLNTGYLRWTVLSLGAVALVFRRGLGGWAGVGGVALVLGLGEFAFVNGEVLTVGGHPIPLPFAGLRALLPKLAITHPLRLALGAQLVACTLAGVGLAELVRRKPSRALACLVFAGGLVVAEGLFGSVSPWPLPRSDAAIPDVYAGLDERPILDLPVEVGGSMRSSRHLWYQTRHGHPIPYVPDVRVWRTRDPETFLALTSFNRQEFPSQLPAYVAKHIWRTYSAVIVHTDLEALAQKARYRPILEPWFGLPEERGTLLVWRLQR